MKYLIHLTIQQPGQSVGRLCLLMYFILMRSLTDLEAAAC